MSKATVHAIGDFPPGTLLNSRYRVIAVVGRGGLATVYRARDESLGRTVALKVISGSIGDGGDARRREDEVRLIAGFNHPNLVTLFDFTTVGGSPAVMLVMQLIEGADLASLIERGPLETELASAIGADVAAALAYIHQRGVIHRDIKPANILLPKAEGGSDGPSALLADFGIARLVDDASVTSAGIVIGTAGYLSPEQATGQPLGPPTDIYSLGLVLLESLTATRAFPGSAVESVAARLASDPVIPPEIGPEWSGLLGAMLARDPGERPEAAEVERRLRAIDGPASDAPAFDGPTRVLPVAAAATERLVAPAGATKRLAAASTPATQPTTAKRRGLLIAAAVAAGATAAVLVLAIVQLTSPDTDAQVAAPSSSSTATASSTPTATQTPPGPDYPVVPGDLGERLVVLQESVASLESQSTAEELQGLVLDITESAADEDYETALELTETLRHQLDAAALTTAERDAIRHANDEVRKQLERLARESSGPGGGGPGKDDGPGDD